MREHGGNPFKVKAVFTATGNIVPNPALFIAPDPINYWLKVEAQMREVFCILRPSKKHMSGLSHIFKGRPIEKCCQKAD